MDACAVPIGPLGNAMVLTVSLDGNISGTAGASKHPISQQEFRWLLRWFKIGWVNQPRSIEGTLGSGRRRQIQQKNEGLSEAHLTCSYSSPSPAPRGDWPRFAVLR